MSRFAAVAVVVACSSPQAPVTKPAPPPTPPVGDAKPAPEPAMPQPPKAEDPYLWLEEVESDKALKWARDRNSTSQGELEKVPTFAASRDRIRAIWTFLQQQLGLK